MAGPFALNEAPTRQLAASVEGRRGDRILRARSLGRRLVNQPFHITLINSCAADKFEQIGAFPLGQGHQKRERIGSNLKRHR